MIRVHTFDSINMENILPALIELSIGLPNLSLCQGERTQDTRASPQCGRDNVRFTSLKDFRRTHIIVE